MIEGVREAASFEGLIALAVFYGIMSMISKSAKKRSAGASRPVRLPVPEDASTPTQQESFSLESVLREIERVKQEAERRNAPPPVERPKVSKPPLRPLPPAAKKPAPAFRPDRFKDVQDERGPLGRRDSVALPSAPSDEAARFPEVVDLDQQGEEVVQRRLRYVEARNRALNEEDHREFDAAIRTPEQEQALRTGRSLADLRRAFVWREILGPPKSME